MVLRSLGHRAPLLWVVVPYAAGIVLGRALHGVPVLPCLAGAIVALVAGLFWAAARPRLWALGLTLALLLVGAAAYTLQRARLPAWTALPPREAHLGLQVNHTFAPRWENQVSGLATVIRTDPHLRDLIGQRIYFSLRLDPDTNRPTHSMEIATIGVLTLLPETPPAQTFEGYLAAAGMNFTLTRGGVLAEIRAPTLFRRFCDATLWRFTAILGAGTAEKQPGLTAVLRAMLLGQKHELDESQDTLFLRSGTMHLFAISGLHIGAIAGGIEALLLLLRLPRWPRIGAGLLLVWLYVQITGGAPSAVRAFTMVALFQAMRLARRPGNPLAALAAAALVVLAVDSMQLFSVSFQLSYGVVAALLLYGLPLGEFWQARFPAFPHLPRATWRWWHHLIAAGWRGGLGATGIAIAAGLVSWVTGVAYFGLFTAASPLANLILVPLATAVILAGMGSLLAGLVGFAAASSLCNHAALLVLWLMETGIRAMVALPHTAVPAGFHPEGLGPAAYAALLVLLAWGYHRRWRGIAASWWLPPAFVIAVLIFGVNFG